MSILDSINRFKDIGKASLPKPNQPIEAVLEFVEQNLPEFINENTGKSIDEDSYTQSLCIILNQYAKDELFWFHFQNKEETKGTSPSIDIAIFTRENISIKNKTFSSKQRFFAFEAKILGVKNKNREKEYVIGKEKKNGGIERFKRNIHGKELYQAGIFGYVLKNDFGYWESSINKWIDELSIDKTRTLQWNKKEKLKNIPLSLNKCKKFISIHSRFNNKPIKLYHYWINLK
ncbi:hypothetical protein BMS3Abin04_02802 [bacterium BMS3Abin04]|nr:hypothetical protein BMS3Abin04_02802 [bacterium BMS3Abin04]